MHGSRTFVRGGSTLTVFFLIDDGREDPNTSISGPSLAVSKTPFKWHFTGMPLMAQHQLFLVSVFQHVPDKYKTRLKIYTKIPPAEQILPAFSDHWISFY